MAGWLNSRLPEDGHAQEGGPRRADSLQPSSLEVAGHEPAYLGVAVWDSAYLGVAVWDSAYLGVAVLDLAYAALLIQMS